MAELAELLKKVQVLNKEKEFKKVIELLTDAILKTYNSADLYAEKAQAFYRLKEYELSNEAAEKALTINPKNARGNHYRGNYYAINNEYDKAIEYYNKAIEADSKDDYPYIGLGIVYYDLKEYDKAKECYKKAIEANPKDAYSYNGLGNTYYDLKEFNKAIEYYNKAIEIDPKDAYSYNGLGNTYYDLKEFNKAIEYYNKAIEIDPKDAYPYSGLGNTYYDLKEFDKAIEYYNKAIEIDPKETFSHNRLGNIQSNLKKYDKAIEYYNKAIENDPKYLSPYYNLGLTYYKLQEFDKAKEYYNKAIEIDPKYAKAYYGLGNVYNALKEYDKALEAFEKNVVLTKSNPDYFTSLAESRITELKKSLKNKDYGAISELVNKIKDLLHYKDGSITHYTGLSVAKFLILNGSSFRLSEGTFLNDTSEGRELFKFLGFNFSPQKSTDTVATPFTQKPFIGSFVAEIKHDDLTLWRMYGKEEKEEAKGCAITIDIKKFLDNVLNKMSPDVKAGTTSKTDEEFKFYRVAYRKEGQEISFVIPGTNHELEKKLNEQMNELFEAIKKFNSKKDKEPSDIQNIVELLNEIAYLFKSSEYQHEFEVRLVVKGIGFEKIIKSDCIPPRVYIELVNIKSLVQKITLGPKVERPDEWAAAFNYSFGKDGYTPEILISHLPFK